MSEHLKKIQEYMKKHLGGLSTRERFLVGSAIAIVAGIGAYVAVYTPLAEAFAAQQKRAGDMSQAVEVAPDMLARYAKLLNRRSEIEKFYEKLDLQKPALSHLEDLLRNTAKVQPGSYTVTTRNQPDFAGKYKHTSFLVRFETANLNHLSEFLKDLVQGNQPMLLSQLTVELKLSTDALSVQVEVSSFEKI